jgi:CheY-like chemotaxis protein
MHSEKISVLVVEDEPMIRLSVVMDLEDAGFNVLEAGDTDEAIALLDEHPDVQALFTDIELPGSMNGLSLAATVRDRWPQIKIIVTSGRVCRPDADIPDDALFMPKPYLPQRVASTIREMINP